MAIATSTTHQATPLMMDSIKTHSHQLRAVARERTTERLAAIIEDQNKNKAQTLGMAINMD